jgi:hypothetical protein
MITAILTHSCCLLLCDVEKRCIENGKVMIHKIPSFQVEAAAFLRVGMVECLRRKPV